MIDRAEVRAVEQLLGIEHNRATIVDSPLALTNIYVGDAAFAQHRQHLGVVDMLLLERGGQCVDPHPVVGAWAEALILHEKQRIEEVVFSADGAWMIYQLGPSAGQRNLYARRIGTDSSIALVATPANETSPALSPDGRWLAYVSTESGVTEVYVRPFPNTADGRWQISAQGGQEPVWSHSGKELFYRVAGTTMAQMVMDVAPGRTFTPGARRTLFSLSRYALSPTHQQYAVTPDGKRFLMIRAIESNPQDHLIGVENFFDVLRARVPRR